MTGAPRAFPRIRRSTTGQTRRTVVGWNPACSTDVAGTHLPLVQGTDTPDSAAGQMAAEGTAYIPCLSICHGHRPAGVSGASR